MYDQITLPGGLRIIGEKITHVRSCSVGCFVGVGSRNETEAENGFSHFIEHMVFKGTTSRTARQIAEEMDLAGGHINAYTSKECTCFYAKVTDDKLELAVDMISDLVLHPLFDPAELEKERGVVLEEISMSQDEPEDVVMDLLAKTEYSGTLSMPILGPEANIRNCSRDDLLAYWKRHYHAENMVLAVSGNYDWDELLKLAQQYFRDFPNEKPETLPQSEQHYVVASAAKNKEVEQLHITLGFPGVEANAEDQSALIVLSNVLGGNMSSRLFQRIREEMGMAYNIITFPDSYRKIGTLNIYTATNPENGEAVIREIQNQIDLLLRDGMTEKEFNSAKAQLRVGYLFGLENSGSRMQAIGRSVLLKGKARLPEEIIAEIDAVTQEKVMALAKKLLSGPGSIAVVGKNADQYLPFYPN